MGASQWESEVADQRPGRKSFGSTIKIEAPHMPVRPTQLE